MNVLDFNHCTESTCDCGWNITLSGKMDWELELLKQTLLGTFNLVDKTDYSKKIGTEEFINTAGDKR